MSTAQTVEMLKNPQLAMGYALEHFPEELFGFLTAWKNDEDMTPWVPPPGPSPGPS